MLNGLTRAVMLRLLTPPARVLTRLGVSPDAVTVAGSTMPGERRGVSTSTVTG